MAVSNPALSVQVAWMFILAAPVACVAWTFTREDVFAEWQEWCRRRSRSCRRGYARKFFYLFTCEYCFSHYVAAGVILLTGFRLLVPSWRGALLAWLAVIWVANVYMSLFVRLRLDIKRERVEISEIEQRPGSPR